MLDKTDTTLADQAFEELRYDIVRGAFRPRQPLRMAELKARYGMGFSPLREALNRLAAERLVVSVPNCGFSVASLSREEMWDATRTRILIETEALRLSIRNGDDAWETGIVSALHALNRQAARAAAEDEGENDGHLRVLEQRHRAFHSALIGACGSSWLLDFFQTLYMETERYRAPMLRKRTGEKGRDIQAEHTALSEAALGRDEARAADLLKAHYERTASFIETTMG